ncbi:hypothetical protein ADZ36_12185 [Streptomyces fradiae]|uniref:DNA-binding protein n=2 Tax=Streptomyces TaxID=1883 RepID=A0A3R7HLS9_9ACTN|nr:hypothetical protein ADZ36_12185 [Streptomyces fradiae]OFA56725.1 hypothetical protein BEN35_05610 [Streptomyces fradiae]PQM23003.1 DNA-binding protein [Streptomyces xinghaiensis]RKM98276.1 DNA-binding protein [Streptomyces xinghaiensis]RNC74078.1 DNA-binding protein [Streptomyces xinghaiensis]
MKEKAHRYLRLLVSSEVDPHEVSDWAMQVMRSDSDDLLDPRTWRALDRLSGADLMVGPDIYLHGIEDFNEWLREFEMPET